MFPVLKKFVAGLKFNQPFDFNKIPVTLKEIRIKKRSVLSHYNNEIVMNIDNRCLICLELD